jgi:hypothetical protein
VIGTTACSQKQDLFALHRIYDSVPAPPASSSRFVADLLPFSRQKTRGGQSRTFSDLIAKALAWQLPR